MSIGKLRRWEVQDWAFTPKLGMVRVVSVIHSRDEYAARDGKMEREKTQETRHRMEREKT